MTENQTRARSFMNTYRDALNRCKYLKDKVLVLQSRAEQATSRPVEQEWTGYYVGRDKMKGGFLRTKDKSKLRRAKHEMVPRETGSYNTQRNSREMSFIMLADAKTDLDKAIINAEIVHDQLYKQVGICCTELKADILRYRYLLFKSFAEIGENLNYSESYIKALYYEALEELGKQIERNKEYEAL